MHNGYFVHPDIWMLWFSFFVSCASCVAALAAGVYLVARRKP